MARLGQKAENGYVGMNCGIMDQFASAACEEGKALLLDCRSLETQPVPVPASAAVVVMDTGARRKLAGSAYNDRRAACERVVAELARTPRGRARAARRERGPARGGPRRARPDRLPAGQPRRPREHAAGRDGGGLPRATSRSRAG